MSQKYSVGERIVTEGDDGDRLFIIKDGCVSCTKGVTELRRLYHGDFFGEQALLYNCKRTASVTTVEGDVKCLYINRESLNQLLGNELQSVLYRNTQRMALEKSPSLNRLTFDQVERLINVMTILEYQPNETIIKKNTPIKNTLFIILKGQVKKGKHGSIVADKEQCLGDKYMMEDTDQLYDEDIVAVSNCLVAQCSKKQFETEIGGRLN